MQFLRRSLRFLAAVQLLPALESGEETLVGGQAVLEGVMMRSPHAWGICVRRPDGTLATHSEPLERLSDKHKWMGWPIIRGIITLGQAMKLGFRALRYSANVAMDGLSAEEEKEDRDQRLDRGRERHFFARLLHLHVQVPAAAGGDQAEERLSRVRQPDPVQRGGRRHPYRAVPVVHLGNFVLERHSARLPVSRRRAQDGLCLRVTRSADDTKTRRRIRPTIRAAAPAS